MKTHHSGRNETAHNKGRIRKPYTGRVIISRPPGVVTIVAIGYAVKVTTTMNPARLTTPERLSMVATMSAKSPPPRMGRRRGLLPVMAAGREIRSIIKRAGMIWLPVLPRRKYSFSLKGAPGAGLAGEAI